MKEPKLEMQLNSSPRPPHPIGVLLNGNSFWERQKAVAKRHEWVSHLELERKGKKKTKQKTHKPLCCLIRTKTDPDGHCKSSHTFLKNSSQKYRGLYLQSVARVFLVQH